MLYIRKINKDVWINRPRCDSDSVSDLCTTNHELSVWRLTDIKDEEQLDRVALALAMGRSKPAELFLVPINPENLKDHKGNSFEVEVSNQDGETRFEKMKGEHKNFMLPSVFEMGYVASNIHDLLQNDDNLIYYNEIQIKDIFLKACNNGEIDPFALDKHWKGIFNNSNNQKGA